MNKFKVGQLVMHMSHGIGEIKSIEDREFNVGKKEKFYILHINDNGAPKKVFVKVEQAEQKIRKIISKYKAVKVLSYIALGECDLLELGQTWNMRFRSFMELIQSGDIMNIARVFVALKSLQSQKNLSFGENKLLEQSKNLLLLELKEVGLKF